MTQRQITLAPGAAFTVGRRVAALGNGGAADPFAVLAGL